MSSAVHRTSTPSASIPLSQNTAPVLEFNCLYTHDIRRKQKRWQDGFLRFHTFNKRVMVYDVPRNFIGDMHWSAGEALQEGDEVMLEKEGVMVEVSESVGKTETDLTELMMSAKKGKVNGRGQEGSSPVRATGRGGKYMETPSRSMAPPASRMAHSSIVGDKQPKHRSLNALLGTPQGLIGKAALPSKSPFDRRHKGTENEEWEQDRPPKRPRIEPWSAIRTTTVATPSRPQTTKEVPLWARTSDAKKAAAAKARKQKAAKSADQQNLGTREVINLSDGDESESATTFLLSFSSDAVAPPSSPAKESAAAASKAVMRSSSPAFQTQAVQKTGNLAQKTKERNNVETKTTKDRNSEQRELRVPPSKVPIARPSAPIAPPFLPPSTEPRQTLRIPLNAPKKRTLACLDQTIVNVNSAVDGVVAAAAKSTRKTQRELLEEKLAKQKSKTKAGRHEDLNDLVDDIEATDGPAAVPTADSENCSELIRMDQMLDAVPPKPRTAESERDRTTSIMGKPPVKDAVPVVQKRDRPFERVVSKHGTASSSFPKPERITGAPVRYTPSPTRRGDSKHTAVTAILDTAEQYSSKDSLPKPASPEAQRKPRKGIGCREIRKSASACFAAALNTAANGTDTVLLGRPFQAPRPPAVKTAPEEKDLGPWSREAFDLFDWRPPNWDEQAWCSRKDQEA